MTKLNFEKLNRKPTETYYAKERRTPKVRASSPELKQQRLEAAAKRRRLHLIADAAQRLQSK